MKQVTKGVIRRETKSYIKNRTLFSSIKCAAIGIRTGLVSEKNFGSYGIIFIVFMIMHIILKSTANEFCIFMISSATVFGAEYLNTAIERICDRECSRFDEDIKDIKDMGAGGVLCMGIGFFTIQGIILIPKILERLS